MPRKRDWQSSAAAGPQTSNDGPAGAPTTEGRRRSNLIDDEDPSFTRRRGLAEPGSLFDSYEGRKR